MRILYPSARHDRFVHSIGTCYLGMRAFECLYKNLNFACLLDKCGEKKIFWDKYYLLFSIACLLHDCGHSPFSHSLEFIYALEPDLTKEFAIKLDKELADSNRTTGFITSIRNGSAKEHEKMSAIVVKRQYDEQIKKCILEMLGDKKYRGVTFADLVATDIIALQNDLDLNDDVEFIMRSILGYTYSDEIGNVQNQIKNCLIGLLNSKNFDMDSLDYIVRDSQMAGLQNYSIDIDRVLNSLSFSKIVRFNNVQVNDLRVKNAACNLRICGTVKLTGHFSGRIFASKYKCYLSGCLDIACNNTNCIGTTPLDSGSVSTKGAKFDREIPSGHFDYFEVKGAISSECELDGDSFESPAELNEPRADFCGTIRELSADNVKLNVRQMNGIISGKIIDGEILSTDIEYSATSLKGVETYILSFNKSALSVLQNIVNARNYEYTTIYGHHKVAYYANYLIQEIFKRSAKIGLNSTTSDLGLIEILNYNSVTSVVVKEGWTFGLISDSDLLYFIKHIQNKVKNLKMPCNKDQQMMLSLSDELFSRNYRKSVWKSFAEFNSMFFCFSDSQKVELVQIIKTILTDIIYGNGEYGYLKPEYVKEFETFGMSDVVWVKADVSIKNPDPDSIYIQINGGTSRLSDVLTVTTKKESIPMAITYLYYTPNDQPYDIDAFRDYCYKLLSAKRKPKSPQIRKSRPSNAARKRLISAKRI